MAAAAFSIRKRVAGVYVPEALEVVAPAAQTSHVASFFIWKTFCDGSLASRGVSSATKPALRVRLICEARKAAYPVVSESIDDAPLSPKLPVPLLMRAME